jgi:hypothetical protein
MNTAIGNTFTDFDWQRDALFHGFSLTSIVPEGAYAASVYISGVATNALKTFALAGMTTNIVVAAKNWIAGSSTATAAGIIALDENRECLYYDSMTTNEFVNVIGWWISRVVTNWVTLTTP